MSGAAAGISTRGEDAAVARAQRQRRLDQIAAHAADTDSHHQHDLEHRADEDHQKLLQFAEARPQDQQRDESGGRQVARERDERLEKRLDRLVGAHQDAERHRDQRGQHEAAEHAPDRRCRCRRRKPCLISSSQPSSTMVERIGQEGLGDDSRPESRSTTPPRTERRTRCRARRGPVGEMGARGFMLRPSRWSDHPLASCELFGDRRNRSAIPGSGMQLPPPQPPCAFSRNDRQTHGRDSLNKVRDRRASTDPGSALITPISSRRSAASFEKAGARRRRTSCWPPDPASADTSRSSPNFSPDCFTSAPMIS